MGRLRLELIIEYGNKKNKEMKRYNTIASLFLAAVMLFSACEKDENGFVSLNVEIDNYTGAGNTKMYIDENNYTHWTSGDEVNINGTDCPLNLSGEKAQITGVVQSNTGYTAIYPAGIVTGASTIELPAEQVYAVEDGKQVISAPMAAYTDNNTLAFTNLCALIRVDVTPNTNLVMERIIVTSSTTNLCGSGSIDFSGTPTLGALDGSKTVSLTFDGTTTVSNGVLKSFYIYVPQFTGGVTVNVQAMDPTNSFKYVWNKTQSTASLSANNIGAVPAAPTNTAKYFFGAGTSEDPFLIYNFDELKRVPVNSAVFFKLMKDINCGEDSWSPIGTNSNALSFKGTFDGNGKTITYKIEDNTTSAKNLGLFGHATNATIKNLKVSGSITTDCYGANGSGIGAIVGYNSGSTIQNCYSTVNITSSYSGGSNLVYGGVVGYMSGGIVSYCFVSSTINGNGKNRVGGIMGHHGGGTVSHCTFEGTVSGGTNVGMIVGNTWSANNFTNCHYYVAVKLGYSGILGKGTSSANGEDIAGTIRSDKDDLQTYVSGVTGYDVYTSSLSSRLAEL